MHFRCYAQLKGHFTQQTPILALSGVYNAVPKFAVYEAFQLYSGILTLISHYYRFKITNIIIWLLSRSKLRSKKDVVVLRLQRAMT